MNTRINYMYRDGCNYKFLYYAVVSGELTQTQIHTILSCLDDDSFIPSLVGLPCYYAAGYTYDEEIDHPFCELYEDDFETTVEKPSVDMRAEDLVSAFQQAAGHWEEHADRHGHSWRTGWN